MLVLRYADRRIALLTKARAKYVAGAERRRVRMEFGFSTMTANVFDNLLRGERYFSADELVQLLRHPVLRLDLLAILANARSLQAITQRPELLHKEPLSVRLSTKSFLQQMLLAAIVDDERRQLMQAETDQVETLGLVAEAITSLMSLAASLQFTIAQSGGDPGPHDWALERQRLHITRKPAVDDAASMRQRVLALVTPEGTSNGQIRNALLLAGVHCTAKDVAQATSSLRRTGHIQPTGVRGVWRRPTTI